MATIFNYSIANDTLNGIVALESLTNEIRANSIVIALVGLSVDGDVLTIEFKADLSASEETQLTTIVGDHEGKAALEDPVKTQWVDDNNRPIESILDGSGVRRLALSLDPVVIGPQGPEGPQGPQGPQGLPGVGSIFGSEYDYAESEGESSTTSGSYQRKLRLESTSLPLGSYRISWFYEVYTTDLDMNHRVQLDDSEVLSEGEHTSSDEGEKHYWQPISGFKNKSLSGIHTIDIDYNDDGGGTARIRRARIDIWRIS